MIKRLNKNEIVFYKRMTALTGGHSLFTNKQILIEKTHPLKQVINSVFSRDYDSIICYSGWPQGGGKKISFFLKKSFLPV